MDLKKGDKVKVIEPSRGIGFLGGEHKKFEGRIVTVEDVDDSINVIWIKEFKRDREITPEFLEKINFHLPEHLFKMED